MLCMAALDFLVGNIWNTCHITSLTSRRQGTYCRVMAL